MIVFITLILAYIGLNIDFTLDGTGHFTVVFALLPVVYYLEKIYRNIESKNRNEHNK